MSERRWKKPVVEADRPALPDTNGTPQPDLEVSEVKRRAAQARWSRLKEAYNAELEPFSLLGIGEALDMLERLRKLTEDAARIINDRLGADRSRVRCVTCKKDLSEPLESGRPAYVWKADFFDQKRGTIYSLYACSASCHNSYVRKSQGATGTTAAAS